MFNNTIGEIIKKEREAKGITQDELCRGLCSKSALAKLENGNRVSEMIVIDALIKRLGKSPDKLEVIISSFGYKKMEDYDRIIDFFRRSEYEEGVKALQEFAKEYTEGELDNVYVKRMQAVVAYQRDGDYEKAERFLKECLRITQSDLDIDNMKPYSLSTIEIENLILLCNVWMNLGKISEAELYLKEVLQYIQSCISDEEEKVKVLPKASYLYGKILLEKLDYKSVVEICEEALELIISQYSASFATLHMELLIVAYTALGDLEKVEYYKVHHKNLRDVYEAFGDNIEHINVLYFSPSMRQYYLDSEIIRDIRNGNEIPQSRFIDGVYNEETNLSRLENGRTKISHKRLHMILEKININKGRYNCYLTTSNFDDLEMLTHIQKLISGKKYEEASKLLKKLEQRIDVDDNLNHMQIEVKKIILEGKKKDADREALICRLENLLKEGGVYKNRKIIRKPFTIESSIIIQLGVICNKLKKKKEAAELLQQELDVFKRSEVQMRYTLRSASILMNNLCKYYEEMDMLEESIAVGTKSIALNLHMGRMRGVTICTTHLATAMERLNAQAIPYFTCSYYLCKLYGFDKEAEILTKHLASNYDIVL